MKKILTYSLVCLTLFACSKDEDDSQSVTSNFSAQIDGQNWVSRDYAASIYNGTITIVGTASDNSSITLNINADSVGLYDLSETSDHIGTYALETGKGFTTTGNVGTNGQVLIEDIKAGDSKISGSFQFLGIRSADDSSINVTNGRFVELTYVNTPILSESNLLTTKINDKLWNPANIRGFVAFEELTINAVDADGVRILTFQLPEQIAPGTYELNYFTKYKASYIAAEDEKHYAVRGNLIVESHNLVNREIEAKFDIHMEEHEGSNISTFTEGEMRVIYE